MKIELPSVTGKLNIGNSDYEKWVWFLRLIAHQPSRVIWYQSSPSRRTAVMLFNPFGRIRRFYTFPKGICPKGNVIAWLEFELAYYDSAVHRFNYYTTRIPAKNILLVRFSIRLHTVSVYYPYKGVRAPQKQGFWVNLEMRFLFWSSGR